MLKAIEKNKGGKEDSKCQSMGLHINREDKEGFTAMVTFKQIVHSYQ